MTEPLNRQQSGQTSPALRGCFLAPCLGRVKCPFQDGCLQLLLALALRSVERDQGHDQVPTSTVQQRRSWCPVPGMFPPLTLSATSGDAARNEGTDKIMLSQTGPGPVCVFKLAAYEQPSNKHCSCSLKQGLHVNGLRLCCCPQAHTSTLFSALLFWLGCPPLLPLIHPPF